MARPVIALLTDFGLRDHYVGVMKGVMLGICPDATLVDITHDITPHDIVAGALALEAARPYFPPATIFLVVVDPGVGSSRRAVALECGGHRFVSPDNGLLTLVADDGGAWRGTEITDPRYRRAEVSRTFEGRDRFAPAAAWLATGIDLSALGAPIASIERVVFPAVHVSTGLVEGQVQAVDRFGNLVTNVATGDLRPIEQPTIEIGGQLIVGVVATYADVPPRTLCALIGSTGLLEIALNGGSAAEALRVGRGAPVHVRRGA